MSEQWTRDEKAWSNKWGEYEISIAFGDNIIGVFYGKTSKIATGRAERAIRAVNNIDALEGLLKEWLACSEDYSVAARQGKRPWPVEETRQALAAIEAEPKQTTGE